MVILRSLPHEERRPRVRKSCHACYGGWRRHHTYLAGCSLAPRSTAEAAPLVAGVPAHAAVEQVARPPRRAT